MKYERRAMKMRCNRGENGTLPVPFIGIASARQGESRAYGLAAYLMRRAGYLPLAEVARRMGILSARISQIQTKIKHGKPSTNMNTVLRCYKLKD